MPKITPAQKIDALYKSLKDQCKKTLASNKKAVAKLKASAKAAKTTLQAAEKKLASGKVTVAAKKRVAKLKAALKASENDLAAQVQNSLDAKQQLDQLNAESKELAAFRNQAKPVAATKKSAKKTAKKKAKKAHSKMVVAAATETAELNDDKFDSAELDNFIEETIQESKETETELAGFEDEDEDDR